MFVLASASTMSTIEATKPGTERSMEHHERQDNDEDTGKDPSVEQLATNPSSGWVRGASIGSGSFGDVYLGMDTQGGRLMAVKQIERRVSPDEEPKYDIMDTYGTDIELWKTLHHENVVQYLGKNLFPPVLVSWLKVHRLHRRERDYQYILGVCPRRICKLPCESIWSYRGISRGKVGMASTQWPAVFARAYDCTRKHQG
jgi:Protein kinase domain